MGMRFSSERRQDRMHADEFRTVPLSLAISELKGCAAR